MIIKLISDMGKVFYVQYPVWLRIVRLAQLYGWQIGGTNIPEELWICEPGGEIIGRTGGPISRHMQYAEALDTLYMADALEEALAEIPDTGADAEIISIKQLNHLEGIQVLIQIPFEDAYTWVRVDDYYRSDFKQSELLNFFSGSKRNYLRRFISFCREGGFSFS